VPVVPLLESVVLPPLIEFESLAPMLLSLPFALLASLAGRSWLHATRANASVEVTKTAFNPRIFDSPPSALKH
jgi:hypothetical protein